jgi:hypothetical protein
MGKKVDDSVVKDVDVAQLPPADVPADVPAVVVPKKRSNACLLFHNLKSNVSRHRGK